MPEKYYTVEEIAQLLSIHPKTIQRYIREGKLRANKVGKGWRVTGHDLSVFAESANAEAARQDEDTAQPGERVKVSCVMDIGAAGKDEAMRIMNSLTAALNSKPPEYGRSTMYVQYLEPEGAVRVMLWGNLRFMEAMTGFVAVLTEPCEKEE